MTPKSRLDTSMPENPAPSAEVPAAGLPGKASGSPCTCQVCPTDSEREGTSRAGASGRIAPGLSHDPPPSRRLAVAGLVILVLCLYAVLLVGWEVVQRHLVPDMSTGLTHGLLVLRAAVITGIACFLVFLMMRRQQQRLATTADRLAFLLESYKSFADAVGNGGANGAAGGNGEEPHPGGTYARFENPHLVNCRDVFRCDNHDCPAHDAAGRRCWQLVALSRTPRSSKAPRIDIQQCHECKVYRLSCPDELTKLGEGFNNLMFLLEEENELVGRMRAQMVEKQKMVAVGQLAAGIAHEVGNPLSSISSIVQMLKRTRTAGLPKEQLDLIETHIERISSIVRQVVSLARPKADFWEKVDVGRALEEAVRLVSFDRRARNVEVDFHPVTGLSETYGVRHELQQVFLNLALNALDAMPNGGRLTIRAEENLGSIVVRVRDTGCGIGPEIGRRIFEPFFTTKEPGRGSGLGLAVSYGIVQKHGGTIDFTSAPDAGTEFIVKIPIVEVQPQVHHESEHSTRSR